MRMRIDSGESERLLGAVLVGVELEEVRGEQGDVFAAGAEREGAPER